MSSSAGRRCYILFQCFPTDVTRAVCPGTLTPPLSVFADPFFAFYTFLFFVCTPSFTHLAHDVSYLCYSKVCSQIQVFTLYFCKVLIWTMIGLQTDVSKPSTYRHGVLTSGFCRADECQSELCSSIILPSEGQTSQTGDSK